LVITTAKPMINMKNPKMMVSANLEILLLKIVFLSVLIKYKMK